MEGGHPPYRATRRTIHPQGPCDERRPPRRPPKEDGYHVHCLEVKNQGIGMKTWKKDNQKTADEAEQYTVSTKVAGEEKIRKLHFGSDLPEGATVNPLAQTSRNKEENRPTDGAKPETGREEIEPYDPQKEQDPPRRHD